jgi:uncharacterized membrane protein YraQ (UPF0718 family)
MDFVFMMLKSGLEALEDYILAHTLNCLVPAFFIAGAMSTLFPKDKILRYLGEKTKAYIFYKPLTINSAESKLRQRATGKMPMQEVI